MKKATLFLFFIAAIFSSCAPSMGKYYMYTSVVDYSRYSQKGFFITESNSVSFEYTPIGSIYVEVVSGDTPIPAKDEMSYETYVFKAANLDDAFQKLVDAGMKRDANGVINVKTEHYKPYYNKEENKIIGDSWVVTGMLIKK